MPTIKTPLYKGSVLSVSRHLETIYPAMFRRVRHAPPTVRRRLELPDGDFLDIDRAQHSPAAPSVAIITHGMEGDNSRPYIKGIAKAFFDKGYDVITWNLRGCGKEINRLPVFYTSGATADLDHVVRHSLALGYRRISLVGFSLGGNLTVKFLGEDYATHYPIASSVAFSVPLDLHACSLQMDKPHNYLYTQRFLRSMKNKVVRKAALFPDLIRADSILHVKSIYEFDDIFTGLIHGYSGAADYYQKCSSMHFINKVGTPLLVVNAANDPFLTEGCLSEALFEQNKQVLLLKPAYGGHCGFADFSSGGIYWSERIATGFCMNPNEWLEQSPVF